MEVGGERTQQSQDMLGAKNSPINREVRKIKNEDWEALSLKQKKKNPPKLGIFDVQWDVNFMQSNSILY